MRKTDVAVQSNVLIAMDRYDWTLQEQKIFLFLVAKVDSIKDKDFRTVELSVNDFAKLIGVENKGSIYKELEKVTKKMLQRIFCIRTATEAIQFQALSRVKYQYGNGKVKLTIHEDLKPFLLELNKSFTKIEIKNIAKMKSSHALRLYEILKMYGDLQSISFQLDDLRKKFGIKYNELINFKDFNRRVLKIAEREINSKTDVHMTYEAIKTGRKVTQINFKINATKSLKSISHIQEESSEQVKSERIYETQKLHDIIESKILKKKKFTDKEKLDKTHFQDLDMVVAEPRDVSQKTAVPKKKSSTKKAPVTRKTIPDNLNLDKIIKTTKSNKAEFIKKGAPQKTRTENKSFLKKLMSIFDK